MVARKVMAIRIAKIIGIAVTACALAYACLQAGALAHAPARVTAIPASNSAYVAGELVVGLDDAMARGKPASQSARAEAALAGLGFEVASRLAGPGESAGSMLLVRTDAQHQTGDELAEASRAIAAIEGVATVQPNYRYASAQARAAEAVRDEDASEQYYLEGPDENGANVVAMWGRASRDRDVDVAVFDTGVYAMPDYAADGSVASASDDAHQDFDSTNLDIEHGVDFVHSTDNANPQPLVNPANPRGDDNGHGTHVASIIAGLSAFVDDAGGMPYGIAGVSPNARIIPVKVLDAGGEGDTADFISAYRYLLDNAGEGGPFANLRVINMSFSLTYDDGEDAAESGEADQEATAPSQGGASDYFEFEEDDANEQGDSAFKALIAEAEARGIATVCAAGNEGSSAPTYPSDYDEVVSVTALDRNGCDADFSNINENKDISAPGVDIYAAWGSQADAYRTLSGTSQSAAIVSGVLATIFASNPALTVEQAKDAIYDTARPVPEAGANSTGSASVSGGAGLAAGDVLVDNGSFGALDAAAALSRAGAPPKSIAGAIVKTAKKTYAYTGKKRKPAVHVTLDGAELDQGEDFTVTYRANKNPGKATVVVKGVGDYAGTATTTFKIKLAKAKLKKLKAGKGAIKVKWKRQKKGKVRYQVRYSAKKSMKGAKVKRVKKNKKTKLTLSKLKSGKRYYVQVRTYKKIGGKTYKSAWSKKKSVKVK